MTAASTTPTLTDLALLRDYAHSHNPVAFQTLATRHLDWIYSTALRLTKNPALAEDVTQGVLLALSQKAPQLIDHPSLISWLFRATHYGASTLLRAERRRKQHEAAAMPTIASPELPNSDWLDIQPRLDLAVAKLPAHERQALLLRFYQQLTHPEIAATLNISEEAARKRVNRALQHLRKLLGIKSTTTLAAALTTSLVLSAPKHLLATALVATPKALLLSKGIQTMFTLAKLKWTAAFLITILFLVAIATAVFAGRPPLRHIPVTAARPEPISTTQTIDTPLIAATPPTAATTPTASDHGFAAPIERTIHGRSQTAQAVTADQPDSFLCLETGELFTKPAAIDAQNDNAMLRWMRSNGINIMGDRSSTNGIGSGGLLGIYVFTIPATPHDWDTLDAAALRQNETLVKGKPAFPATLNPTVHNRNGTFSDQLPATWLFKTKTGQLGILQITEVIDAAPFGVKIRYKLAK